LYNTVSKVEKQNVVPLRWQDSLMTVDFWCQSATALLILDLATNRKINDGGIDSDFSVYLVPQQQRTSASQGLLVWQRYFNVCSPE
jgi:hypothetical protein